MVIQDIALLIMTLCRQFCIPFCIWTRST